ncbi:hypothetical protein [Fusibacter sp. 3D3]|uniref:hypothetical protein n=1 Tax=Fusibacter sp. 3D3 TaxID=1048380 RepID=UPI000852F7E2|nr:hypothetical protein [Fusibacter sp. 3D3]GAU78390.1 hypothetical protein F3D3_3023 [Fusibacter sp. 3D3]
MGDISQGLYEWLEHFQWGDRYDEEALKDEIADIEKIMLDKVERNKSRFPVDLVKGNSGKHTKKR